MADRKLQYIIEILPKLGKFDDIKKKLEDGVTLSPKEIQLLKGQLGEAFKGASQEAMALGKEIKKAMSADDIDTSTLVNAVKMIAGAAKELKESGNPIESWGKIGSSIVKPLRDLETRLNNIDNDLSKLKNSSKVLDELKFTAEGLKTSFAGIGGGTNNIITKIATAMTSIGIDKSAVTNMKQFRAEMDKLTNGSKTIKLDIDYGSLKDEDLFSILQKKYKTQTSDLSTLLGYEWGNLTMNMPDSDDIEKTKKHLFAIYELEKKISSVTGRSPVDEYFFEDTGYEGIKDIKETLDSLTKETEKSVKETVGKLEQGVKTVQQSIAEKLGQFSQIKIDLSLDDANKIQFKNSIDAFVNDLNSNKYGEINTVKVNLDLNEPEKTTNKGRPKSASKKQIEETKTDIQKKLDAEKEKYDKIKGDLDDLNNRYSNEPQNTSLKDSINKSKEELKALEKSMVSYKYLLSQMDDYDTAKYIVSDWKKFSSASQNIRLSQYKLLTDTRKWRNEMNKALKFNYQWKIEGTEDEFDKLSFALTDMSENKPIKLMPDIDFLVNAIEEGLSGREINVKLTADGPINAKSGVVVNSGIMPVMSFNKPVATSISSQNIVNESQTSTSTSKQEISESKSHIYIDSDIDAIVKYVENEVEKNEELKRVYSELLKDTGVSDKKVAAYIDNVKNGKTEIPKEIIQKYGSKDIFIGKLKKTKEQVGFNNKLPFFNVAEDILGLKDIIKNNPEDETQVRRASEQIKALLIKSIVDSFKTYNSKSKERFKKNEDAIKEQENIKSTAVQAYNSDEEKQKRLDKITTKKQEITELESNTAIKEYENLLQLIDESKKQKDKASLDAFLQQEKDTLPSVKKGYQELVELRKQLSALYKEDPNDANLLQIQDAEKRIASLKRSNEKIIRSRQAYENIGVPLNQLEGFINTGDSNAIYDLIVNKILSNSNVVQSMGSRRKTSEGIDPIYLFDTTSQKLMTTTIDMVQKALSITQKTTSEMDRRIQNEGLLRDLRNISEKKSALSSIFSWGIEPRSKEWFEKIETLFDSELQKARQIGERGATTGRERAYVKFATALDSAVKATDNFREVYNSWSSDDVNSLLNEKNEEEWFKQKYSDQTEASKNYQLYTEYQESIKRLVSSISREKNESTGKSDGYGIYNELKDLLQGYEFRVVLVDDNGSRTVDVGKPNKLNKTLRAGSVGAAKFLAELPEDLSQISDIKFYNTPSGRNAYDKPSNVELPVSQDTNKKPNNLRAVAEAKRTIANANRVIDESANIVTAQEVLDTANQTLETALEAAEKINSQISSITGGVNVKEYKENLIRERDSLKISKDSDEIEDKNTSPLLSNKFFDQASQIMTDETKRMTTAIAVRNNPINSINFPSDVKRMMEVVWEINKLNREQKTSDTDIQLKQLSEELKKLTNPWTNSVGTQGNIVREINSLIVANDKVRDNPTNEKYKENVQNIKNSINQDLLWYEKFLSTLPNEVRQLGSLLNERNILNNTLPASNEEAVAAQSRIQELNNSEIYAKQLLQQWVNNIKYDSSEKILSTRDIEQQGAPMLAKDYQKKLVGLVDQTMSLSKQLESDPNNEELKTQMQGIVDTISELTVIYKDFLNKYGITTKGFLGNENQQKAENALNIYRNPTNQRNLTYMSLWGGVDKFPESIYKMIELAQKDSELTRLIPTLPDDQRKLMEAERRSIAKEYEKERTKVLQWVEKQQSVAGTTGIFAGLGNSSKKFKNAQAIISNWINNTTPQNPQKVDTEQERNRLNTEISQLNALNQQAEAQARIVANARELIDLTHRRIEIEKELNNINITAERKSELETELESNKVRSVELGARNRKFITTSVDAEKLQDAYMTVVSDLIDQQEESDNKIRQLNSEIEHEKQRLSRLELERTQDAVAEGKRHTQDSAIKSTVAFRASDLATDNPEVYAKLRAESESEHPISDFYDYLNPYEHQAQAVKAALSKKAESYIWTTITEEEERKIIQKAIESQKNAIAVKEAELQAEREHNHEIVANREKYKTEGNITDEMIAARRSATEEIRREARIVRENTETMPETMESEDVAQYNRMSDVNYQNYTNDQNIVKATFADGTSFEGSEVELQEMIAAFGEPISQTVEASNQQLENARSIIGTIVSSIKEDIGNINFNKEGLATEATLSAIRDLLDGGSSNSGLTDDEKARMAELEAKGASRLSRNKTEDLKSLLISNPSKVLDIAKSNPERVKKELFNFIENFMSTTDTSIKDIGEFVSNLDVNDVAKVLIEASFPRHEFFERNARRTAPMDHAILDQRLMSIGEGGDNHPIIDTLKNNSGSFESIFKTYQTLMEIVDTVYPNQMPRFDITNIDSTKLQEYSQKILMDLLEQLWDIVRTKAIVNFEKTNGYNTDDLENSILQYKPGITSIMSLFGITDISEDDFLNQLMPPIIAKTNGKKDSKGRLKLDYKALDANESDYVQNAFEYLMKTYSISGLNAPLNFNQETAEIKKQLKNEKVQTKSTVPVEPEIVPGAIDKEVKENVTKTPAEAPVIPTVRETDYQKAVETVRGAIGDFSLRTSNVNKAEKYNSLGQEVKDAANVLRTTKEGVTKEGNDLLNKMRKLRDAANKVAQKETKTTEQTTVTEETSNEDAEMEMNAFQEGISRVLSRVQDMADRIATLENEKASLESEVEANTSNNIDSTPEQSTTSAPQGGIIGAINNLAKESTLGKVLTALGEIAKKNAMAGSGKANSAQDLLEQFRRMLESDAWEGKERVAYIDLNTGSMSNTITGDNKSISAERLTVLRNAYKDVMDLNTQVHTHANEEDPYFSADDFKQFGTDFANGITKQILLSKNNMTVLDMTDVKNIDGLLQALSKTEQNFEALATTANKFGAKYISKAFNEITPQGLVKMLGIKGIESKLNETETRDAARKGVIAEDAKEAADMLQESTGRSVKTTLEQVGLEIEKFVVKTDKKGNEIWTSQINNKVEKAMRGINKQIVDQNLDGVFGEGTDAQLALTDYTDKYTRLLDLAQQFKGASKDEQSILQEEINQLLPLFNEAEKKLLSLIARKDKFMGDKEAVTIFTQAQMGAVGDNLKTLATNMYAKGLIPGDNIAFNGISETPNGTRLLVDILKDGTIQQYALEVDRATGQVKEFMLAETALANAFQNVNKAMRLNETVKANVAVGDNPTQQQNFLNDASSPLWNNYKKAMSDMETYVANIWNRMANGGRGASQKELDYVMALSEKVIQLGRAVQKTSTDFKTFWADNPEYVSQANIKTRTKSGRVIKNRDEVVRAYMEERAKKQAKDSFSRYDFVSFDNDKLIYKLTDIEGKVRQITLEFNELYQQIAMTSNKSIGALDPIVSKIEQYKQSLERAKQSGYLNDVDFAGFNKAQEEVERLARAVEHGTAEYNDLAEARANALKEAEDLSKIARKNERQSNGTNQVNAAKRQYTNIQGTYSKEDIFGNQQFKFGDSPIFIEYKKAYDELIEKFESYKGKLKDPTIQEELAQEAAKVKTLGREFNKSATEAQNLEQLVEQSKDLSIINSSGKLLEMGGVKELTDTNSLRQQMENYAQSLGHANMENVKFNATKQQMTYTMRINKDEVADMVVQYNKATNSLYLYNKQQRESLTGFKLFAAELKKKMGQILQYTASITSLYRVFNTLRQGITYVKEIDAALTELKKVTDETEKTYDNFLNTAAKTASKVGSTIKEVVSSTADFARLGYSLEDAAKMAENAQLLMNVSEFTDISSATDTLISAVQAFSYTADETLHVVDILNKIGK